MKKNLIISILSIALLNSCAPLLIGTAAGIAGGATVIGAQKYIEDKDKNKENNIREIK